MTDAGASSSRRPEAVLQPTPESERLHALDAMRGVAILGVLVAYTVWNLGNPPEETWSRADHLVARLMDLFVDGKFITMFACLFGIGIAQQWSRWEAAGNDPLPLHLRRMGLLFGIGLLHAALLRNGDILVPYSILGLALLGFRHASSRTIVVASVLLVLTPLGVKLVASALGWAWPTPWPARPGAVPGGYIAENLAWLRYWYLINPVLQWPGVMGLVLAGYLIGRSGVIEKLASNRPLAGRVLAAALAVAVLTRIGFEWLTVVLKGHARVPTLQFPHRLLYQVNAWSLAAAYGAALLLIVQGAGRDAPLWPLRAIGRMAFTNYLLQALIVVPLCLAFGLFDTFTPTRGVWLALAVAAAQAVFSAWWLKRYRMGPLERVWRGATYGRGHVSLARSTPTTPTQ